ncbi:helix-turn-helix domain-containing protein [Nakamurella leprariae]|uniref:Helix-turn-helix transcriptional regulator n=1 Tax=Nakamurella leprariae TaxID=2803911 RepID=A0A939BUZ2_9ACTN|nr:XRE family transcriptional regulator [Nakamurella leprariae]MBM9466013.1 helix-turn-helix transcriptional regulator [Nakamurella leprariae]
MTDDVDAVLDGVGARLQAARRATGATLAEVAAATKVSSSTLSRLENGRLRPTLEQLLPLARFYAVPLDDLVGAQPTGDPRVHLRPVRRGGMIYIPLSVRPGGIQAYKIVMPPSRPARASLKRHPGYEWLYVLSGRVRLLLGDLDLELGPGEAAEFDTREGHWLGNADDGPGGQPAELVVLFGREGERAHLTTGPGGSVSAGGSGS